MYNKPGINWLAFFTLLLFLLLGMRIDHAAGQSSNSASEQSFPVYNFGGFLQQQILVDQTPEVPTRFYIHRARVGITGAVTERISVNLIGGFSEPPANTPRLVNAFIDFDIHPLLQLRTGQFLLPFGLEGPLPIFLNSSIERSTTVRRLNTFTMFRDIGIQASGRQGRFRYAVALVNGNGANNIEQSDSKDVMGRLGFRLLDDVEVGASGHAGTYQPNPAADERAPRSKVGLDINYDGAPFYAKGEYIVRWDEQPSGANRTMTGGYLLGGYIFTENLRSYARYEYYDPADAANDDYFTAFTLGGHYYFVGNTRISINYELRDDQLNPELGNLLTVQMQVTF